MSPSSARQQFPGGKNFLSLSRSKNTAHVHTGADRYILGGNAAMQVGMYGDNVTLNFTCEIQYVKIPHSVCHSVYIQQQDHGTQVSC